MSLLLEKLVEINVTSK